MKKLILSFIVSCLLINWMYIHAEAQNPTVTISHADNKTVVNGAFDVTITFSEAVEGFVVGDINVTNGSAGSLTGTGPYTSTITPAASATSVSVDIAAGAATAQAGSNLPNDAAPTFTMRIDKIAPTVTITQPSHIQKMEFMTTITFSEDVTGFNATADVKLMGDASSGATVSAPTPKNGSKRVYEVTITPAMGGMKGELIISVPAGAATDLAGNASIASSTSATVNYNPNAPTVTLATNVTDTQTGAFDITVEFGEAVDGFEANDIGFSGASASASKGTPETATPNVYPVTITPSSDGTLEIFILAGRVEDAVDDDMNVASNTLTVEVDVMPPRVTEIDAPATRMDATAFDVTITFSESVTGFSPSNLMLTNATPANAWSSETATTYTVAITPSITDGNEGVVEITVPAGAAQDGANRDNAASTTKSVTVDRERPTVDSITGPTGTQSGDFDVTITFSEPVYKFESTELNVSGGASAPSSWKSGDDGDTSYTATIDTSGMSSSNTGSVKISVESNDADDAVGNGNFASSSTVDETVTVDNKKPTTTIQGISGTQSRDFTIRVDFDEGVSGFSPRDHIGLSKQSGNVGWTFLSVFGNSGASQYGATIRPTGMGTLRISISAGRARDSAGNTSKASSHLDVMVDTQGPKPTITPPTGPQNGAFDVTIDFGETVTGFVKSDITLGGTATIATGNLTGSGASYTLRITPSTSGTVTIDVAANVAKDGANHNNEAATRATVNVDLDDPTLTIAGPTTPQKGAFDVTFTFNENVTGFAPGDVTVSSNATKARNWKSGATATTYVLRLTPTTANGSEGTVTIDVAADKAKDTAGNDNEAATQVTVDIDKKKPTLTITAPTDPQKAAFDVTFTFKEAVTGFVLGDVDVTNATKASDWESTPTATTYMLRLTPTIADGGRGFVTIHVAATKAVDTAGNGNIAATQKNVIVDKRKPTLTITGPTNPQNGDFDAIFTFNESVTGFVLGDVDVTNATKATRWKSTPTGTTFAYVLTLTPSTADGSEGMVTINVAANKVKDRAGNDNVAATEKVVNIDKKKPTLTIAAPTDPQNGAFDVTFTFNEPVTDFIPGDVTVSSNATKGTDWKTGATTTVYTLELTPTIANGNTGTVTIDVAADKAEDTATNGNVKAPRKSVAVDKEKPTVSISTPPSSKQKDAFMLTITFSEDVTGFAKADLMVDGEATATAISGGPKVYTATITPNADKEDDDVTVKVKASTVIDAAGNNNTASAATPDIEIDTLAPTPIFTVGQTRNVDFTVVTRFSETVSGFSPADDIAITGPAELGRTQSLGNLHFTTVTPNSNADGDVTFQVNAGAVTDDAGNSNALSKVTFRIDTIEPTPRITAPTTPQSAAFDITIDFGEDVSDFVVGDLRVGGATKETDWKSTANGPQTYGMTLTPSTTAGNTGTVTIDVGANVATDAMTNNNRAASRVRVTIDKKKPTLTIAGPTTPQNGAFDVTFTFLEAVTGFDPEDVTVSSNANKPDDWNTGETATTYTLTLTPTTAAGNTDTVTIDVAADKAKDLAGNNNVAASQASVAVDKQPPTVSIAAPPSGEQNSAFDLTITFSEDVTGFAKEDLTVTGEATATAVAADGTSKTTYTATIKPNPNKEGDVTVTVDANTVIDAAGNNNTASTATPDIHIDTIPPTVELKGPTDPQGDQFEVRLEFSEPVRGYSIFEPDVTITGPGRLAQSQNSSFGSVVRLLIGVTADSEGDVTLQLNANAVVDGAGNSNAASAVFTVPIDTIAPTVTIEDEPTTEQKDPYDVTIRFREPVNDFAVPGDLNVGLTAEPGVTSETPIAAVTWKSGDAGAAVYVVTVTPNTAGAEGDVTITVNANTVTDGAGNGNTASPVSSTMHIDTIDPTVAISGLPSGEQKEAFPLTITFDEDVKDFGTAGLTVAGPATATAVAPVGTSKTTYTATITPNTTSEGDVTVTVAANAATDNAGNGNTVSTPTGEIHVDTIKPTVTSITGAPTTEQNDEFTLTITFSEDVNDFGTAGLTLTGGVATATAVAAVGTSKTTYTATITPNTTSAGDVTVTVAANAVTDEAGNGNTVSAATDAVHVDTIPPTVSMVVTEPTVGTDYPTPERNAPYTLTVTFSEPVNGFAVPGDLTVTGLGTATSTTGADGDTEYVVTITPDDDDEGDVSVTVNANTVVDFATNANLAGSETVTTHIDTTAPTFTIEDTPVLQRRNDFFDIEVAFSEPVNDFRPEDFTASDLVIPTIVTGTDGARTYTVRMTPNENVQGDLIIEVGEDTVQDIARNLNANSVATTQPVRIDTIPPTVEITDLPTGVKNEAFDVTITFAEAVNGFTTEDITLVGPATVQLTAGTDGDATYTAQVTPNANSMGNVTLQIPAAVVLDLAENANLASELTPAIAVDTNALTVELEDVPDTVQLEAFSVMIVFSNSVDGFVLGDIQITGDAVVRSSTLLGSGSMYTLNIMPDENTDGDVIITVPANVAQDATSKFNTASVPQTIAVAPRWMPDAILRNTFREELNVGEGEDFTPQQLRPITRIEVMASGVQNLTGIEQATALSTLRVPGNEITDITPLRRLTRLTTLDLGGNAITNISVLENLTALTSLNLSDNAITDIAALEDLTSLTALDLSNNSLTDISVLTNFTALTTLNLAGNSIADIAVLAALTNLRTLNLNDNTISNFTPLSGLTALTTLELGGTGLSSLNAISGLTGLTSLNLSDNALTDIALLSSLTSLTTLNLSENAIADLTTLAGLTSLTTLNLNANAILDITSLARLTRLTTLELADNTITTLTPLTSLTVLTRLDLRDNAITDVTPVVGLTNLRTLLLMGNPILNTAPLYPLTQRPTPVDIDIAVSQYPPWDVNEDGTVDAADSALVTAALGQTGDAIVDPRTDVNGDGTVDNADVLLVTSNLSGGVGGAPSMESLLSQLDTETRLLANYPNPFNPETWIPYELATDTTVEIFIYNTRGVLVRHLELGHQPAGYYIAKSRAAYWDGHNTLGERVSSGIYFYQLRAGNISLLRKMVILK